MLRLPSSEDAEAQQQCAKARRWPSRVRSSLGQPALLLSVFPGQDFFESVVTVAAALPLAVATLKLGCC